MNQTLPTKAGTTRALLIGVDDYKSFDRTGLSDLKGSRNDVVLLACYCVEVLGMRPENIVALVTRELTAAERDENRSLQGVRWGGAGETEVKARLASLLDVSRGGTALLAFSGHGAALPGGEPVLCLGDTAPGLTSGVLSLKTLRDDIESAGAKGRLIALLDCCHVASRSPHRRLRGTALPHAAAADDVVSQEDLFRVSDRVLLAARPGKQAYQVRLGKAWHGALTFALVTAADRWQGENEVSHGSYKHVLNRAKRTLKALGVRQRSEFRVPEGQRVAIGTSPFLGVKPGPTQRKPDAVGSAAQLNPDFFLKITVDGVLIAQVVTSGATGGRFNGISVGPNTELWFVDHDAIRGIKANPGSMSISATEIPDPFPTIDPRFWSFQSPEATTWQEGLVPRFSGAGRNAVFSGTPAVPENATAYLWLVINDDARFPLAGVAWGLTSQPGKNGFVPGSPTGSAYIGGGVPATACWFANSLG